MLINTLFIGVPIGLRNLGDINDDGVHAVDDFPSLFDAGLGDLWPDGVCISGVEALGVAGIDISSVSGLSSILSTLSLSDLSLGKKAWKVEKPQNEEVALRVCVNVTVSLLLTQWGVYIYSVIVLSSSSSSLFYNLLTTVSLCVSIRLSTIKNYNAHCFCFFFSISDKKNF